MFRMRHSGGRMTSLVVRFCIVFAVLYSVSPWWNAGLRAQSQSETITYDFRTKEVTDTQPVRQGEFSRLKIVNINRFVYDVDVSTSLKKFVSSPPPELSLIVKSAQQTEAPRSNIENVARAVGIHLNDSDRQAAQSTHRNALKALDRVHTAQQRLASAYVFHDMLSDYSTVSSSATDAEGHIQSLHTRFPESNRWEAVYDEYLRAVDDFLTLVSPLLATKKEEDTPAAKELQGLESLREVVAQECTVIKSTFPKLLRSLHQLITLMQKEEMYEYLCPPVQAERDYIQYTLSITPRNGELSTAATTEGPLTYKQQIYGGFRFSFSTGFAAAFGVTNRRYRLEATGFYDNDSAFIRQDPTSNFTPMLSFNVHTAYQTGQWYRIGMMFGLAYRINAETTLADASFLLGLTFHIGAVFAGDDEIMLGIGGIYAPVQQLRGQYSPDQLVRHHTDIVSKLLEPRYKDGWFLSLSYNLTGKAE